MTTLHITNEAMDKVCEPLVQQIGVSAPWSKLEPEDKRTVVRDLVTELCHKLRESGVPDVGSSESPFVSIGIEDTLVGAFEVYLEECEAEKHGACIIEPGMSTEAQDDCTLHDHERRSTNGS